MKTSRWRLNDENLGQMNVDGVLLVSGRLEGVNPPDHLGVSASKDVLDVFLMDGMISLLPKKSLVRAKLKRINGWKMNEDRTGLAGCVSLSRSMVFSRRFEGVSELPGNLLYGQEDPPDPLGVGAYKDVLDVFWMNGMISLLPKKSLVRAKLKRWFSFEQIRYDHASTLDMVLVALFELMVLQYFHSLVSDHPCG
ncbi:hypothetical protein F2Q68_00014669 [Brassica cretica]|uniref:Uncharacterized protein n=1 Tax=Brassica cretica TaxID=69181 RepID=A0A8S9HPV6_BRACR|nr:hypothetical protein F2Q68_00014669 [Brassica cretica]